MVYTPNGYYVCGASVRVDEHHEGFAYDKIDEIAINGLKVMVCGANDWTD